MDVLSIDAEEQCGLLQPAAITFRTGDHVGEAGGPLLHGPGPGLGLFKDVGDDALETYVAIAQSHIACHLQWLIHPIEQVHQHGFIDLLQRRVQVMAMRLQHGFDLLEDP